MYKLQVQYDSIARYIALCNWLYNDYIIRKVVSTKTHIEETLVIIIYTLTYHFKTLFIKSEKVQTNYQYDKILIWVEIIELILIFGMFN